MWTASLAHQERQLVRKRERGTYGDSCVCFVPRCSPCKGVICLTIFSMGEGASSLPMPAATTQLATDGEAGWH
jgi:hypothetical protein